MLSTSLNRSKWVLYQALSKRTFASTQKSSERYFMVEYTYNEDSYYRRSKSLTPRKRP